MNPAALTLHRSAPLRLLDDAREWLAQHVCARETPGSPHGLDRHLLRDIGLEAGWSEARAAEAHVRVLALRMQTGVL